MLIAEGGFIRVVFITEGIADIWGEHAEGLGQSSWSRDLGGGKQKKLFCCMDT